MNRATESLSSPPPPAPPGAWEPLRRAARWAGRPLERFLHIEAASGILLLLAAAAALLWANSPWQDSYRQLWQTQLGFRLGDLGFERSLEWWVNDGLMVIFFFVVGLEIRREVYQGELSEPRRAALPAAAALGGMAVPAGLYLLLAGQPETRSGWGVPMATDIAFALGVLTLLGKCVPAAMRVLLLALAVIDDLGAIIVIALFYSSGLNGLGFIVGGLGILLILVLQRLGVRAKLAYLPPALIAWGGVYAGGVHPTIAGVVIGLMTPVVAWYGPRGFMQRIEQQLDELRGQEPAALTPDDLTGTLESVRVAQREAISPAESLIHSLHPWVAFAIMPIFALANAGVTLSGMETDAASTRVMLGTAVGLVLGKPIGVLLACWITLKLGLGVLPRGLSIRHLLVLGLVAGIGFTMALFIAQLAFGDPDLLAAAKLGILSASAVAAVLAMVLGRVLLPRTPSPGAARTADEAEKSTTL